MAQNRSLESMLDDERRDVLALLEGTTGGHNRGSTSSAGSGRSLSPFTPRSPVRSMLDIAEDPAPRSSSVASANGGITGNARVGPIRSMLDIDGSPHGPVKTTMSAQTSPTQANVRAYSSNTTQAPHRSLSDAAARPVDFGPRANVLETARTNPTAAYQFAGYLPSNPGGRVIPKRNTQAGKKTAIPTAMSEVVRGADLGLFGPNDRGRNHSIAGTGISAAKSKSPHNRLGLRSNSPHGNLLSPDTVKYVLDDGRPIDMNSAYRRLSDANLALSGGGLSTLSGKGRRRPNSGDAMENARLEKDYIPVEGDDTLVDSSDDDEQTSDEGNRGRKKQGRGRNAESGESQLTTKPFEPSRVKGARTALTLLGAAEEERQEIAAKQNAAYKVRSLLEPEITVTAPSGSRAKSGKPAVHPNTSFDEGTPGFNTPVGSDTEADFSDIKRAQKLAIHMTTITSTPMTGRCVRTIYRGDFGKMQQEAHDNQRRVRKYLVATDLSDEAAHALEWTLGTVLRDGDTLLAIYCVDEETGIGGGSNEASGDDAHTKEQVVTGVHSTKASASTPVLTPVRPSFNLETASVGASPMGRGKDKAEQERYRAVQDITDRVSKLLRKTRLQVKVVIEVIHCKSPKHMITEVIDYISPTLVILGSRGRSALKGVILGSFSNYLVTKSSAPVMVARKRLRKHTKYKRPAIRLANNLSSPVKSLEKARVD
ncbi:Adenine nucleotide alpha hydrolases-like protein [Venustampulla echinocandica]|uniref:Adenine nucleotide alpha hydrolases-like protein n=1 Tax=Venustampulla echinocandica TaxID=2656787 RepID=A0A370TVL9_9HELO|nr:Adenine nucleotide alpha hydrolases-like protein [Venustampulla echinocandica]RDL39572.1 Adenine nucleotide alpha hydrolases-like protein [Venustampulla echinocandica]